MIYIDMDGVLCDWHGAMVELINHLILQPYFHPNWWVSGIVTSNMISSLSKEFPSGHITKQDLVDKAGRKDSALRAAVKKLLTHPSSEDWWAELPRTDLCDTIMEHSMLSKHQWCILTKPIAKTAKDNRACIMGKTRWLYNNFGKMHMIVDRDKAKYASPNSLLIDDTWDNIVGFRAEDGVAFMVKEDTTKQDIKELFTMW